MNKKVLLITLLFLGTFLVSKRSFALEDTIEIDMTKKNYTIDLSVLETQGLIILEKAGVISYTSSGGVETIDGYVMNKRYKNKDDKYLFIKESIIDPGKDGVERFYILDGVDQKDNITYELTPEDKNMLLKENLSDQYQKIVLKFGKQQEPPEDYIITIEDGKNESDYFLGIDNYLLDKQFMKKEHSIEIKTKNGKKLAEYIYKIQEEKFSAKITEGLTKNDDIIINLTSEIKKEYSELTDYTTIIFRFSNELYLGENLLVLDMKDNSSLNYIDIISKQDSDVIIEKYDIYFQNDKKILIMQYRKTSSNELVPFFYTYIIPEELTEEAIYTFEIDDNMGNIFRTIPSTYKRIVLKIIPKKQKQPTNISNIINNPETFNPIGIVIGTPLLALFLYKLSLSKEEINI